MATIDWPAGLVPQAAQLSLRKAGAQFASPFNGTLQAVDFIGERWTLSASLAAQQARDPNGVHVFCNTLAGGIERVRVWPFHTGGVPRGRLRGLPTASASAARGATALAVANATAGANLLRGGGFEGDANGDGVADGWVTYTLGSVGTATWSRVAGQGSTWAQRVDASALGALSTDRAGVRLAVDLPVQAGTEYTFAADMRGAVGLLRLQIDWRTAGGATVGQGALATAASASWTRYQVQSVAPAGAEFARIYAWVGDAGDTPAAAWIEVDNAKFEAASAATTFEGEPTLLRGDFLGCAGQLFMVAADTVFSDVGAATVPLVNRVRSTIAINSPITWYRPSCEMVLPAMQAGALNRPGLIDGTALDLVEVW